jgi:hypothetical protein
MSTLDEIRARDASVGYLEPQKYPEHSDVDDWAKRDRRTLLALLDAQSLELQAVREERDELLVKLGKHLLDKARAAADIMDRKARTDAATSPADIAELPGT